MTTLSTKLNRRKWVQECKGVKLVLLKKYLTKSFSIKLISLTWALTVIIAYFLNLHPSLILGSIANLVGLFFTVAVIRFYRKIFKYKVKIPRVLKKEKELKIILIYMLFYFLIQFPVSYLLKTYSYPLMNGMSNFIFDGYATLIKTIITLIIPLVWIIKNNYLKEIGFTTYGFYQSIIAIIPTSLIYVLFITPTLLIYEFEPTLLIIAIGFSFFRAGLPEELIFRPLLQERIERSYNSWTGILLSSIIFSLLHFPGLIILAAPRGGTNAGILTILTRLGLFHFTISLVFGYIWTKTKNITGNIILHTLIDTLAVYQILTTTL